jgi:ubiquinone biosynthesis monooxygenase Coq7
MRDLEIVTFMQQPFERIATRQASPLDAAVTAAQRALETLAGAHRAQRAMPLPDATQPTPAMTPDQCRESASLMRVNHVGEVCAQALYEGQALGTANAALAQQFRAAARDEEDHLAWTRNRLDALGGRASLLNPLWFAGAFAIGYAASRLGDSTSLGFMAETERQVEAHLQGHLQRLPAEDTASRAVVRQMKADESAHGHAAVKLGAAAIPWTARAAMRMAAKVMTTVAHRI